MLNRIDQLLVVNAINTSIRNQGLSLALKRNGNGIHMKPEHKNLLAFIKGKDCKSPMGVGISTYPKIEDENNKRIYNMCLDLEKLGLIYRKINDVDHVFWIPKI